MSRAIPIAATFACLLLIAATAFLLFESEEDKERERGTGRTDSREGVADAQPDRMTRSDSPAKERVAAQIQPDPAAEGERPASFLKALGIVKGRVVEEDGTPVPGFKVEAYGANAIDLVASLGTIMEDERTELKLLKGETQTAEDGTFRLVGLESWTIHLLGFGLGGPRPTVRLLDAAPGPGEIVDLGDIVLAPYGVITGIVLEKGSEKPVSGVRIRAADVPQAVFLTGLQDFRTGSSFLVRWGQDFRVLDPPSVLLSFLGLLPFPTTQTAADGTFRLEGVPLGTHTVLADRRGFVTAWEWPVAVTREEEKDVGTIFMDRGVSCEGRVVDVNGEAVPDAEVRLGTMYGVAELIVLQPSVFSRSEGKFAARGLPPKAGYAVVRRLEADPWTIFGPFDPELEPPTIVLPPTYDLRVTVSDSEGTRLDGAGLKIRPVSGDFDLFAFNPPVEPTARMKRPEPGVIDIIELPPGKYGLVVRASGYGVVHEEVELEGGPLLKELILEPAEPARVRVLSQRTKQAVEWAEVVVSPTEDLWFNPRRLSSARTDATGLATIHSLAAGSYRVTASHPLYAFAAEEMTIPGEETMVLLEDGGAIEGQVHRGGSPHEAPFLIGAFPVSVDHLAEITPRMTVTDLDGVFSLTHLSPGTWKVSVLKRVLDKDLLNLDKMKYKGPLVSCETEVQSGVTTRLEIDLSRQTSGPRGHVTGAVTLNGRPAVGAVLHIFAKQRYSAFVGETGLFDMGEVPEGEHLLRIVSLPGPTGQYDLSIGRRVKVQKEIPAEVYFEILTGQIEGKVVRETDGSSVRGVRVTAELENEDEEYKVRLSTATGLDGTFRFDGVPVGIFKLDATSHENPSRPVSGVEVTYGGVAGPVELVLVSPAIVTGRIVLPEGCDSPRWLGMMVKGKEQTSGTDKWVWVSRDELTFETRELIPGTYSARVHGDFGEGVGFKPVEIQVQERGVTDLLIKLEME